MELKMKKYLLLLALLSNCVFAADLNSSTLKNINTTNEIKIGVRNNGTLFSDYNAGQSRGYVVDLCNEIAKNVEKQLGKPIKIKYVEVTPTNRFELLNNNKIDMECGTTTVTTERQKEVDFSLNTFVTSTNFLTLKRNQIPDIPRLESALNAKKIAIMDGTPHENMVKKWSDNVTFVKVSSIDEGIKKVKNGEVFAFVQDQFLIESVLDKNYDVTQFALSKTTLSVEPYSIAVRKNDVEFKHFVNKSLRDLYTNGFAEKSLNTWLKPSNMKMNYLTRDVLYNPVTGVAVQG